MAGIYNQLPDISMSTQLRQTFDEVADLYQQIRPVYPAELFSALIETTGIAPNSRLLEIGPGTGQATKPLAELGFDITGIELGPELAQIARSELRQYDNVRIVTGAFEDIPFQPMSFDLVFAATSFHWIDPRIKYVKTHEIIKPDGHLAIIHTNHVSDEKGDSFLTTAQPIYEKYSFATKDKKVVIPRHDEIKAETLDRQLFDEIYFQSFPLVIEYKVKDFIKLLNTFSNHLSAPPETRQKFFDEIENLMITKFSGKIEKHYSMSLTIAKKTPRRLTKP